MKVVSLIEIVSALGNVKGCKFASIVYTAKESGEIARHTILLGFNYRTCVAMSLEQIKNTRPMLDGIDAIAADELIESFSKTLNGTQDKYTKAHVYADTAIGGLKVNTNDDTLQLFGLVQSKVIIAEGIHKPVKSAPLTIAKNKLRKSLPIGKFREYALDGGSIHTAKLSGETIHF